jgi:hypothetical protein
MGEELDTRHSGAMRQHRTRNLEIPRCAIAHLRSGPEPVIGRREAPTRWDHPGMTVKIRVWRRADCPTGKSPLAVCRSRCPAPRAKIFCFSECANQLYIYPHPAPQKGRFAVVTNAARVAVDVDRA